MAREWNEAYRRELRERFATIVDRAADRLRPSDGLQAPSLDDVPIGGSRRLRAAVLFLDICGFSQFTGSTGERATRALLLLNTVIPTMMSVVYDHDGYVEKNTGDGLMAIIGAGRPDTNAANEALAVARTMTFALSELINPHLRASGVGDIQIRISIDLGTLLLARIGVPTGAAAHQRSFLTAIGPAANLASKMVEDFAQAGQILVGDLVKARSRSATDWFINVTPVDWTWIYEGTTNQYPIWNYTEFRNDGGDGWSAVLHAIAQAASRNPLLR